MIAASNMTSRTPDTVRKALGEVTPGRVTHEGVHLVPPGTSGDVPAHAFHNEATIRAGEALTEKYLTDPNEYPTEVTVGKNAGKRMAGGKEVEVDRVRGGTAYRVPSITVQSGVWEAMRRSSRTMRGHQQGSPAWTAQVNLRKKRGEST